MPIDSQDSSQTPPLSKDAAMLAFKALVETADSEARETALGDAFDGLAKIMANHNDDELWIAALIACFETDCAGALKALARERSAIKEVNGFLPLHAASCRAAARCAEAMIEMGADASFRDESFGRTALTNLAESEDVFVRRPERCVATLRALWAAEEAVAPRGPKEESALERASGTMADASFFTLLELEGERVAAQRPGPLLGSCMAHPRRLRALKSLVADQAWDETGVLTKLAESCQLESVRWMLDEKLGLGDPAIVSMAISHLSLMHKPPLDLIEALLPRSNPFATDRAGVASLALAPALEVLLSRTKRRDQPFLDALDLICAFEPAQHGAQTVWDALSETPLAIPRLHALHEAKALGQALASTGQEAGSAKGAESNANAAEAAARGAGDGSAKGLADGAQNTQGQQEKTAPKRRL
jgi:hypothetical protein